MSRRTTFTNKICEKCRKVFVVTTCALKRRFCSKGCSDNFERGGNTREAFACPTCSITFHASPKWKKRGCLKYCSKECSFIGRRRKVSKTCSGCSIGIEVYQYENYCSKRCWNKTNQSENHYLWAGENARYTTKHAYIRRRLGSADHCEDCGLNTIPEGKKRFFDWANISGEYKRDIADWKQLCRKCHRVFDSKK